MQPMNIVYKETSRVYTAKSHCIVQILEKVSIDAIQKQTEPPTENQLRKLESAEAGG